MRTAFLCYFLAVLPSAKCIFLLGGKVGMRKVWIHLSHGALPVQWRSSWKLSCPINYERTCMLLLKTTSPGVYVFKPQQDSPWHFKRGRQTTWKWRILWMYIWLCHAIDVRVLDLKLSSNTPCATCQLCVACIKVQLNSIRLRKMVLN
jgi:hypothetical protein